MKDDLDMKNEERGGVKAPQLPFQLSLTVYLDNLRGNHYWSNLHSSFVSKGEKWDRGQRTIIHVIIAQPIRIYNEKEGRRGLGIVPYMSLLSSTSLWSMAVWPHCFIDSDETKKVREVMARLMS